MPSFYHRLLADCDGVVNGRAARALALAGFAILKRARTIRRVAVSRVQRAESIQDPYVPRVSKIGVSQSAIDTDDGIDEKGGTGCDQINN